MSAHSSASAIGVKADVKCSRRAFPVLRPIVNMSRPFRSNFYEARNFARGIHSIKGHPCPRSGVATEAAGRAEAERKSIADSQMIIAIWNTRQAGGRELLVCLGTF